MSEIAKTGYWSGETAHIHHVHCKELSKWIIEFLKENKNKRTYDLGCGLGNYVNDLRNSEFTNVIGIEKDIPKKSVIKDTLSFDLTLPNIISTEGNVISLEVGEHIPAEFMNTYLNNITSMCDNYLITSWAVRGQAGFGHVNCLDNHEIIPEIEKRGFKLMEKETEKVRNIDLSEAPWFKNTLLIFKKNDVQ